MKTGFIYLAWMAVLGAACTPTTGQFTIKSHINGLKEGDIVRLVSLEQEEQKEELLATDTVKNGTFLLKGKVESPTRCRIEIPVIRHYEDGTPHDAETSTVVMVENVAMTLSAEHVDSLPLTWEFGHSPVEREMNGHVTGGRAQNEFNEYRAALHPLELKAWKEEQKWRYWMFDADKNTPGREDSLTYYKQRQLQAEDVVLRANKEFVSQHPSYSISVDLLRNDASRLFTYTVEELDSMVQLAGSSHDTFRLARLKETVEMTKQHARGVAYRDFTLQNEQNKEIRFSDCLRPEVYTLIDFWASWCGPCRAAIPHVKELHERYGDRLDIISVSVDKKMADWSKAVQEENMPWRQFLLPADKMKEATEGYQFSSIPTLVVIAPDGTIQCETGDANEIDAFLSSVLAEAR